MAERNILYKQLDFNYYALFVTKGVKLTLTTLMLITSMQYALAAFR